MKKDIVFATSNVNKVSEVRALLGDHYIIKSLSDIGIVEDIPETENSLEGNAKLKAQYVFDKKGLNCFSEDTGLEIESLNNEPGVRSARYAGLERSDAANMEKVLKKLKGKENRKARFRTVIALVEEGKIKTFEGIVNGKIAEMPSGHQGFGYDPIFIPEGFTQSFAEMSKAEKNQISHRGRAIQKLVKYLNDQ